MHGTVAPAHPRLNRVIGRAATLLYALFTIMTRSLVRTENALSMLFYNAVVGTVVASAVVVFSWVTPTLEQLAFMALIGAVGGGSHLLVIHAYRNAPASLLAPFQYLQMVWATAWGYLLFSHFPDNWTLAGAGVIVSSGLYVWFREIELGKQRRSTSWRGGLPR